MGSHRGQITLKIDGLSTEVQVGGFSGHDGLSELFVYDVNISSEETIDATSVVGANALLSLPQNGFLHGLVNRCQLAGKTGKRHQYQVRLVPCVWPMAQGQNCRIFQGKTVQAIVETLFGDRGLAAPRFVLKETPEPRVFCVQYHESDWAFITRLLEESGIYYYFTHGQSGHEIVFTSDASPHPKVEAHKQDGSKTTELPYHPTAGQNVVEDHVTELVARHELKPDTYVVREQQLERPWELATFDKSEQSQASKPIEIYDYVGEPKGRQPARLPQARLEEQRVPTLRLEGSSTCAALRAGIAFDLVRYVDDTLNKELLLVRVEHRCSQGQDESGATGSFDYGNRFTVILRSTPFRPPPVTPRPVIHGVQAAVVVGPAGEEIYTDELSRVKVQFPWDRLGANDDKSSAWVPVAQLTASSNWGALFIPRIGEQVIVEFLDGDPDQPLIIGQVYHRRNMPPASLPGDKTQTVIKTNSSPTTGGYNEIRLEDKAHAEMVTIRAELDRTDIVQRDMSSSVGRNKSTSVGKNETYSVGVNYTETVGGNWEQTVKGNKTVTVTGNLDETIGTNVTYTVGGSQTETISGAQVIVVGGHAETVLGARSHIVTGSDSLVATGSFTAVGTAGATILTPVQLSLTGAAGVSVSSGASITLTAPAITISAGGSLTILGGAISVTGGSVAVAGGDVSVSGGTVTVTGGLVKLNC